MYNGKSNLDPRQWGREGQMIIGFPSKGRVGEIGGRVIASEFPDSDLAREAYWIPFLKETLQADAQTILVGHSSGAIAAMRFGRRID